MIEKIKNYSEIVKEVNFEKKPKAVEVILEPINFEVSKREKMLEFAKRIPKPSCTQIRSLTQNVQKKETENSGKERFPQQIEFLENQHQFYQQKLKDLRIH